MYVLIIFIFIFGPKYGIVDFSILGPIFLLSLKSANFKIINKNTKYLISILFVLTILQTLTQLINVNYNFESLARIYRVIISVILARNILNFEENLFKYIFFSITIHAILVIIGGLNISICEMLSMLSGNQKNKYLRCSALLAGFDISGLLIIIGSMMLYFKIYHLKYFSLQILIYVIFLIASIMSSRISFAIISPIILLGIFKEIHQNRKIGFLLKVGFFMPLLYLFYELFYFMYLVFEVTMSFGFTDVPDEYKEFILERSAAQDPDTFLWRHMFFLPNELYQIIIGTGAEVHNSDVGFVNEIFRYGIVGLTIALLFHFIMLQSIISDRKIIKSYKIFFIILTSIILILSFKNNYIFTRAIFPLYIMIFFGLKLRIKSSDG